MIERFKFPRRLSPLCLLLLAPLEARVTVDAPAASTTTVTLTLGEGRLLRFDQPVESVLLADTKVADVQMVSPGVAYVYASALGHTNMIALGVDRREHDRIELQVVPATRSLRNSRRELATSHTVEVVSLGTAVRAQGNAATLTDATRATGELEAMAGPQRAAINDMTVAGASQVNIRVRFAEMSRSKMQQYGVNWDAVVNGGAFDFGFMSGGAIAGAANRLKLGAHWDGNRIDAVLDALQTEGALTILAEPNITTMSGQTASFLAGGEIPVPVPVTNQQVGIEYKSFGVSLLFTPVLQPNGRIAMRIRPEVSSLSATGMVTIAGTQLPAFQVRRADTMVEMGSGQTIAIAGLFQRDTARDVNKLPLLGDIPILGQLLRSERFQRRDTELVILITPYLVAPVSDHGLHTPSALAATAAGQVNDDNLRRMAERPDDLRQGRDTGPAMAAPLVRAARRLTDGPPSAEKASPPPPPPPQ